jgi:hypothetical protein
MRRGLIYNDQYEIVLLSWSDFLLVPFLVLLLYFFLYKLCSPQKNDLIKYFNWGFLFKIGFTFLHFLVITYIFKI